MQMKIKWLLALILILLTISITVIFFVHFWSQKNLSDVAVASAVDSSDMGLELGQNMVVGIPGPTLDNSIKNLLHKIKPGGIVLYRRNYQSDEQFKSLIHQLQVIANQDSGVPYFIMVDEEPDGASRLNLLTNVFTLGLPDWGKINAGMSKMANLGVTVDLAPVVDYPFNQDSFISNRVPTNNLSELKAFSKTFIKLLAQHNIAATLKHFPGAGVFVQDPHKTVIDGYVQQDFFNQSISLFKNGIDAGAQFVMTNHAIYSNVDPINPATLSGPILTGILKQQLGFKGIIITDDIEDMLAPIYNIEPADAGVRALKAGDTMIMYGQSLGPTLDTFKKIEASVEKDQDLERIVKNNYQQIIDFKNK